MSNSNNSNNKMLLILAAQLNQCILILDINVYVSNYSIQANNIDAISVYAVLFHRDIREKSGRGFFLNTIDVT